MKDLATENWNAAYQSGKYKEEGPIPFVQDIIKLVTDHGFTHSPGFYPGCGNGRNYIPLLDAGLNVRGNDISPIAVEQLKNLRPDASVSVGDFLTHTNHDLYSYLVSLQLFQHGNQATITRLFKKSLALLESGGLFFLRLNSIHTEIVERHEITEQSPEGSYTICYQTGTKKGQEIHFYSAEELHEITRPYYEIVLPLREKFMPRHDGTSWAQWETILIKK